MRAVVVALIAVISLVTLTGCRPACDQGYERVSHFSYFQYISTGKSGFLVPIYTYACEVKR